MPDPTPAPPIPTPPSDALSPRSSEGVVTTLQQTPRIGADSDLLPVYLLRFDREATRRAYTNDLTRFFESDIVTLRMARSVTFVHVNRHIETLQADGFRPSTIQRRVSGIRGFFSWLLALGFLDRNPADRQVIRRGAEVDRNQNAITVLSTSQARRLVAAARETGEAAPRDTALIQTLLYGALRRSEAAAMDAEHLRMSGPYWVLHLPQTKGGSDQHVKLPAHVVEAISEMSAAYGITSGPLWRSLSNNSRGRRLSARSIYTIVNKTAVRAGIDVEVGVHTLRHTACTLAIEGGATPQQVQTHARHKKLETTMMYVHQRDKLRYNASDYINL